MLRRESRKSKKADAPAPAAEKAVESTETETVAAVAAPVKAKSETARIDAILQGIESHYKLNHDEFAKLVNTFVLPNNSVYKKSHKRPKYVDQPTRPLTSYLIFTKEHRELIKKENPALPITDVLRKAGQMWKLLNEDDKKIQRAC